MANLVYQQIGEVQLLKILEHLYDYKVYTI